MEKILTFQLCSEIDKVKNRIKELNAETNTLKKRLNQLTDSARKCVEKDLVWDYNVEVIDEQSCIRITWKLLSDLTERERQLLTGASVLEKDGQGMTYYRLANGHIIKSGGGWLVLFKDFPYEKSLKVTDEQWKKLCQGKVKEVLSEIS